MVSTDTPASVATAVPVVAEYPLRRNSAAAASRTVWRLRRACSRRPLESYRRFLLTRSTIRSTLPYQFHITVTDGLEVVAEPVKPIETTSYSFWMSASREGSLIHATAVSYTHLRAHETDSYLVCRLLLE